MAEGQTRSTLPRAEKRCRVEKCKRPYRARGYCNVHYREWRHGGLGKKRYKICTHEACRKPRKQGGLCEEHGKPKAAEGGSTG